MSKVKAVLGLQYSSVMRRAAALVLSACFLGACGVGVDEVPLDVPAAARKQAALEEGAGVQRSLLPRTNPIALPQDPIPERGEHKIKFDGTQPVKYRKE